MATKLDIFKSDTAQPGSEEYFKQAMAAGYYGCDDLEMYAFRVVN